ncbi:MAG: hypothetical protein EA427_01855 [Spirochaetaceae bacterium]|nr:MAG: hypothetical protein EA427_01855 [Spirochaetaceae bacterium]
MEPVVLVFIAVAAFLGLRWHRGSRVNYGVITGAVEAMEKAFSPRDKTYINIGGVVGYNFVYELDPPFRKLEGTIVTLPRQAVLYLPISRWLLKREDMLLFTLYCGDLKTGRGHIVEAARFENRTIPVEDRDSLSVTPAEYPERSFVVLWYNPLVRDRLRAMLDRFSGRARRGIRYLGYYGSEGHMAFTVNPGDPELPALLEEIRRVAGDTSAP